jgi:hypothetical protein
MPRHAPILEWETPLRGGLLNGEIFTTLLEAKALIENWRRS